MGLRCARDIEVKPYPSVEELRDQLRYDAETGLFWWNISKRGVQVGKPAGTVTVHGYNQLCIGTKSIRAAVAAWAWTTGEWPDRVVDHINGDKRDDRWVNLRLATPQMNNANKGLQKNNTSGFKGVSWSKQDRKWRAVLQGHRGGKVQFLGNFDTPEAAYEAYCAKAVEVYGEFARL